ncbi:unknown [Clostridium sp. CAG:440]|nr:unknown [Clostridium sp. CAG:440]
MVFLFILLTIIIVLIFSKIQVEIENFRLNLPKNKNKILNDTFLFKIKLVIFGTLPIINLKINREKLKKLENNLKDKKIKLDINKIGKQITKENINDAKKLQMHIEKIKLKINFGTENTILTSFIVPIISTIWSIVLTKKRVKEEKQRLEINPIYNKGNLVNIVFEGIFEIKMIHIIKVICAKIKKRRVEKYERTSNRRAYDYSYE